MPATKEAFQKLCFQRSFAAGEVGAKGFSDVTLITGDREALGHGIFVDEKSIEGLMSLLMGKSLPGYLTHDGAIFSDRLGKEIGFFSGFYREGMKLKAKAFSFLNSFIKHDAEDYEKLVELAEKMPDQFGLSVVFSGNAVWTMEDGSEVDADEPMPEGALRGKPSVRFESIESADFVKAPAANDGLFADGRATKCDLCQAPKTVTLSRVVNGKSFSIHLCDECGKAKFDEIAKMGAMDVAPLAARIERIQRQVDGKPDGMPTETIALSAHNEALAAKTAEISALTEKLAAEQADKLALSEKLAAAEKSLEAKSAAVEQADKKLTETSDQLSAVTKERDEAAKALAESEAFDMRKLGVRHDEGGTHAGQGEPAPVTFKNDAEKWTAYAALLESDPTKAAAFHEKHLKAAWKLS